MPLTTVVEHVGHLQVIARSLHRRVVMADSVFAMPEDFDARYVPVKRSLTREQLPKLIAQLPAKRAAVVAFIVATSCENVSIKGHERSE